MNPVASVLSTAEVLDMIMNYLDTKCLLNCRLVSSFWDKTASSVLKRRPAWITVDTSCDAFTRLYKCVSKSKDFPFPGFKLASAKRRDPTFKGYRLNRLTVNAPKYFVKFGQIHSHLDINVTLPRDVDLIENVLAKLPNIKFLEFHQLSRSHENEELDLEQFSLPKLTTLSLVGLCGGENERVLKAIINAAPLLVNIKHVWHRLVPLIWEFRQKVELVSSMILEDQMDDSISHKFVATPPSLRVLSILRRTTYPVRRGSITAIHAVFFASRNTLTKLVLCDVCINLDHMAVLEQLRVLEITVHNRQLERDLCTMLRELASRCFPKLHKIRFDLQCYSLMESFNRLEVVEELESVDVLDLKSYFVPSFAQFLARKFPRVRYIRVNHKEPGIGLGSSVIYRRTYVWSLKAFPCLNKLEIQGFTLGSAELTLDQFFTGIPNEICAKLRKVPKFEMDSFYSEILRPNGSLIELKNLKEITLSLETYRNLHDPSHQKPIVSMVTVWYALDLVPNIRMRFFCRPDKLLVVKKLLEPIQDHVTADVWM